MHSDDNKMNSVVLPNHIAPEQVHDFDIYRLGLVDGEYHKFVKVLHSDHVPDIFWTTRNGGHWVATRAADIDVIGQRADIFSSKEWGIHEQRDTSNVYIPLNLDPPEHGKYRALLQKALSPVAVAKLTTNVRTSTLELIKQIKSKNECEFMSEFAFQLPIGVFLHIVSLPLQDKDMLLPLVENIFRPSSNEARQQCTEKFMRYVAQKVEERAANPGSDLISHICQSEIDGKPIPHQELSAMVFFLLAAGLDTVASMLGFFALFLAKNPSHCEQLRKDPDLIPKAVDELMRRYSIVLPGRVATTTFEYKGVVFKKGDRVALMTSLYGLDESRFENPMRMDFNRKKTAHGAFGFGPHRCIGSLLAKRELQIFLEEWLTHFPNFQIADGSEPEFSIGITSSLTRLRLSWC